MRELSLEGIHEDDEHLVLVDSDGGTYTLRIDESLRAAVRRDRPALGMIRARETTPLRPREIQAMLRAGRAPEAIAEMSGITVEHIQRYEGPVLAERAYIAQRARRFHLGRGGGPVFGEVVEERLQARKADESRTWDAWRLPDATWTVELLFTAGGRERSAHWIVDVERQTVLAEDDEARWLTDDDAALEHPPGNRGRLTPIRPSVYDVEADGSFDPVADSHRPTLRTVPSRSQSEHPSSIDPEDLDALQARRGIRAVPTGTELDEPVWEPLDGSAEGPDAEAEREHRVQGGAPDDVGSAPEAGHPEDDADAGDEHVVDAFDAVDSPDAQEAAGEGDEDESSQEDISTMDTIDLTPLPGFEDERRRAQQGVSGSESADQQEETGTQRLGRERGAGRKKPARRSSVPSWDEIVFGSKGD